MAWPDPNPSTRTPDHGGGRGLEISLFHSTSSSLYPSFLCCLCGKLGIGAVIAQSVVCWVPVLRDAASRVRPPVEVFPPSSSPLELTWVLAPFPKIISDEIINRGLVCAHMHSIARTQKILTCVSQLGGCRQQKHTQHAPSTKMEYDYLYGWIIKTVHTQTSHQHVVNPRDIAGNAEAVGVDASASQC